MSFVDQYGPWALVAGASMGLGAAFAHEVAVRGSNVVMLARGADALEAMAAEVRAQHGVEVRTIAADLSDPAIGAVVAAATDHLEVGLLVYNATVAPTGRFIDTPLEDHVRSVAVNCTAPVILCHLLAPKMAARGRGGIGLVGSMGGTQGSINFGTYNAGKAFEWILGETLWAELGDAGVDVTTMLVGPTSSPNFNSFQATLDPALCNRPDTDDPLDRARSRLMAPSEPAQVALALLDQLTQGPVSFACADDAWISETTFGLPRADAVGVWRGLQESSTRLPDRQAR